MPTMLAQEHLGFVEALQLRFGAPAMTDATFQNACGSLGGVPGTVILTMSGTGIWAFNTSFSTPSNVTTLIPAGVTVAMASGAVWTSNGPIMAYRSDWKTGLGFVTKGINPWVEVSALTARDITIQTLAGAGVLQGGLTLINATTPARTMRLYTELAGSMPGIQWSVNEANTNFNTWQMNYNSLGSLVIQRPGSGAVVTIATGAVGIGIGMGTPTHQLQMQTADAAMPGGGPWLSTASDRRVKTHMEPYTDGLPLIQALEPVWFEYNGLAETPTGARFVGLVADDVQAVAPYMVGSRPRKLRETDAEPTEVLNLNTGPLLYALIRAVQALATRLDAVEGGGMSTVRLPLPTEVALRLQIAALEQEKAQMHAQLLHVQQQALLEQARLRHALTIRGLLGYLQESLPVPLDACTVDLEQGALCYDHEGPPPGVR